MNIQSITLSTVAVILACFASGATLAKSGMTADEVAASLPNIELNGQSYPALGPLGKVPTPADNPTTPAKVALGKQLFFDGRLGGDTSTPCFRLS